jgi:hypothetical protein
LTSETALLAAVRRGDEDAFSALVDTYGTAMHRVALTFVRSSAVADEVVQEAWLGALRGPARVPSRLVMKTEDGFICTRGCRRDRQLGLCGHFRRQSGSPLVG